MTVSNHMMVYVTFDSRAAALHVARTVVEERLAACANLRGAGDAVYVWDGAVQEAQEWVVLFKTRTTRFDALKARIVALHSYEVPCIVAWNILEGHPAFLDWIDEMT